MLYISPDDIKAYKMNRFCGFCIHSTWLYIVLLNFLLDFKIIHKNRLLYYIECVKCYHHHFIRGSISLLYDFYIWILASLIWWNRKKVLCYHSFRRLITLLLHHIHRIAFNSFKLNFQYSIMNNLTPASIHLYKKKDTICYK